MAEPIYAQLSDIADYMPGFVLDDGDEATRLIAKAEQDVDHALPPSDYLDNGRKYDPTDTTTNSATVIRALKLATCAQFEYRLYLGPGAFIEDRVYEGATRLSPTTKPRNLSTEAKHFLIDGGLLALTGRMT